MEIFSAISGAFHTGGIWMWAIFFAQIASIALIVDRVMALFMSRNVDQMKIAQEFEQDIRKGQLDKVMNRARSLGASHPIGNVIQAGTQAALDMGGRDEIQSKMDEVLLHENSKIEKRTGFLAMIGNVATLLGLLGTIVGMIDSFKSVASSNPIEKATMLSQGISMAMHATAYGLIVAIPALVLFSVFQNRANTLAEDLNQGSLKIFNWLSYSFETVPHKKAKDN